MDKFSAYNYLIYRDICDYAQKLWVSMTIWWVALCELERLR